jgi:hypothetical protein
VRTIALIKMKGADMRSDACACKRILNLRTHTAYSKHACLKYQVVAAVVVVELVAVAANMPPRCPQPVHTAHTHTPRR